MSPAKKSARGAARPSRPRAAKAAKSARAGKAAASGARKPAGRKSGGARTSAAAAKPRLGIVTRAKPPARRAATPPAFPQTAGASSKNLVLFRLVKARAQLLAAIQGLVPGAAGQPLGVGKWSPREVVLHLCCRDRARLREFEAALRGVPVSWQEYTEEEYAAVNARDLAAVSHLAWDEALRLLHSTRQSLTEAIEGVPEEPVEVWAPEHPFGWMLYGLPAHDQHHAEILKKWRSEVGL